MKAISARVAVRKQGVADGTRFDVAQLPPFIPPLATDQRPPRVVVALRPRGWLIMGHGESCGARSRTLSPGSRRLAYGGTPLNETATCHLPRNGRQTVAPCPPCRSTRHHHRPQADVMKNRPRTPPVQARGPFTTQHLAGPATEYSSSGPLRSRQRTVLAIQNRTTGAARSASRDRAARTHIRQGDARTDIAYAP
jgi:hypothetical protein